MLYTVRIIALYELSPSINETPTTSVIELFFPGSKIPIWMPKSLARFLFCEKQEEWFHISPKLSVKKRNRIHKKKECMFRELVNLNKQDYSLEFDEEKVNVLLEMQTFLEKNQKARVH